MRMIWEKVRWRGSGMITIRLADLVNYAVLYFFGGSFLCDWKDTCLLYSFNRQSNLYQIYHFIAFSGQDQFDLWSLLIPFGAILDQSFFLVVLKKTF